MRMMRRNEMTAAVSRSYVVMREKSATREESREEKKNKKLNAESNSETPIFQAFFGVRALHFIRSEQWLLTTCPSCPPTLREMLYRKLIYKPTKVDIPFHYLSG